MLIKRSEVQESVTLYKIMSQTVIPRPIAWISTEDDGVLNIAPFSYFIPLASTPPTLLVSVGHHKSGAPKDTLYNLRKHGLCTISLVEPKDLEKMHRSATPLAHTQSEASTYKIETESIYEGFPPMVVDTPAAYFCRLHQEIELQGPTVPLVLEIEAIYLADRIVTDKARLSIDFEPLMRIGKSYATVGERLMPPEEG